MHRSRTPLLPGGALALAALAATLSQPGEAAAQGTPAAVAPWTFGIAPYFWAPSVEGQLRYDLPRLPGGPQSVDVSMDKGSLLGALNFGVMVAGEARRDRFSLLTDFIYLDLDDSRGAARSADFGAALGLPVSVGAGVNVRSTLRATVWGLAGGYTLAQGSWGRVDVTAGFRLFDLNARSDIRLAVGVAGPGPGAGISFEQRLKRHTTLFDGVVGLRGSFALGSGFSLPYALDIGGGTSTLTWQAMAGVAYQAGRANVTLGYRALHYEQGGDRLLRDATLAGPFLAVSVTF